MKNSDSRQRHVRHYQHGHSLIELMIAMVIGSFLILGIMQIFITTQKSYLFQQSQIGNQENGRFTLAILGQELSKAGYRSLPTTVFKSEVAIGCTFPERASVVRHSDTSLCIRYQAANRSAVTCQGTALPATEKDKIVKPYNQINTVIVERIAFDSATKSITCTTSAGTQQLVTGIAGIHFDYGYGSGADKTLTTFSSSPTQIVGAVRYAALMQSDSSMVRDTNDMPKALTDWNTRFSAELSDTKEIYQVVQSTILLRNQLP